MASLLISMLLDECPTMCVGICLILLDVYDAV